MLVSMAEHAKKTDQIPDLDQCEDGIIGRVLEGNQHAFREIVELYAPRVLAFCRVRLHSEEEAQDAAQEVFIRAYKSLSTFRRGENFASWLFAIAANNVRTHFRIRAQRQKKEAFIQQWYTEDRMFDPEEDAELALQKSALRNAVQSLPEDLRKPVALYYFAELSVRETAHVLGVSEEAVKTRLFRARHQLREIFQRKEQRYPSMRGIIL